MNDVAAPLDAHAPDPTEARGLTGQRRYVTVLFCDVSDSTRLAEELEAEEFASLLAHVRTFARDIIPRHGGVIARMQGDGVLALFGCAEPHEDDGRRAGEAALQLHAAVETLGVRQGASEAPLHMHSGIHGGLVLLLEGDIERGRYDVVGVVPHTAARLCSLATAGEILASAETLGPQAHFFQTEVMHQVPIRGRSTPLDVVRVQAQAAAVERRIDAAALRGTVPFFGREAELAALQRCARDAQGGRAVTLLVTGEPGIGKTRLVDEFARTLDRGRCRVLRAYCEAYLGAAPLQPFVHWVREALGGHAIDAGVDNRTALLASLEAIAGERQAEFASIVDALAGGRDAAPPVARVSALVAFLAMLARQRTLVLLLDDWQWADDASRHALESLRQLELPMLVLLASRPTQDDDHALSGVDTLALEPLASAHAQAAVAAWLPDADPFVMQEVLSQAGGSPLFIEELCQAAASGNDIRASRRNAGAAWIATFVASRLARLPAAQADVIRKASVVGNTFGAWLLERLLDPGEATPLQAALAAHDFIVPAEAPGLLRFKHGLTHAAVYASVEPVQRRALHLRVAELVEDADDLPGAFNRLESLSYHFDAAGQHDKTTPYAEEAGDRALGAMALDRARAHYITALGALDAQPLLEREDKLRWCAIAQKLGQTCVFDPLDVAYAFGLFERAARLARATGDQNTVARADYWLAYVNYGKGRPRDAVIYAESALDHAQASHDQRLAAQVQATLAQALASAGLYERAMPLFTAAVQTKRQSGKPGSGTAIGLAYTLGRLGYTLGDLGRFDEAHEHFQEALVLLGDKAHSVGASVRELTCVVHLWQGRWQDARDNGQAGAELALRCRSRYLTMMGRALGACGEWMLHRDPAAVRALHDATYWIEARGGAVSTSLNYGWLVEACIDLEREADARKHAARLFMRARVQDRHGEAIGCRALARAAAARGDERRALRDLARADRAAADRGSPREAAMNALARAEVAARLGQGRAARDAALRAADGFASMQMAWHAARAAEVLRRLE